MTSGIALLVAFLIPIQIGLAGGAFEPAISTVRLDVRASPECTSRGDLVARITARSPRIRVVDDDTALAVEAVFTTARSGNVIGELVLAGPRGTLSSRRLLAHSCAEAADAVALIIAVTLDPTSARASQPAASTATSAETSMEPSASASTAPPLPPAPATQTTAKPAEQPADGLPQPSIAVNPTAAPSPSVAGRRRVGAHVAGQSVFGPAPAVMPGIAVYAMAALDRDAPWSPAILLGATHVWINGLVEPGGTASFTLDAASLDACPIRLHWSAFEARACGSVLLGLLSASGSNTRAPATVARLLAAAGGTAVLSARLASILDLTVRLGVDMTLVRDSYKFGPNVFHRAAGITSSASLGIGLRLP